MENEPQLAGISEPTLPRARPFEAAYDSSPDGMSAYGSSTTSETHGRLVGQRTIPLADAKDRTGVFQRLVNDDGDITGLVAYSIYKQHKLDWLRAFEDAQSRAPNTAELTSYIIGEGTVRRLATYRHLAEATLAGNGLDIDGSHHASAHMHRSRLAYITRSGATPASIMIYGLIALLFIFGFWFALHFTMSSR